MHAPADVTDIEDVPGRKQCLEEQVAVVKFLAAVAPLGGTGGDQIEGLWPDFPWIFAIIHPHQADHTKRNAAHGHQGRECNAAADETGGAGFRETLLKCVNQQLIGYRHFVTTGFSSSGQRLKLLLYLAYLEHFITTS